MDRIVHSKGKGLTKEILKALAAPFPERAINWKPGKVMETKQGPRALAMAYLDARNIQERLDSVVGGHWEFHWEPLIADPRPDEPKAVKGTLTIMGVSREDVGETEVDKRSSLSNTWKAAVSDALKRCAVHFGIGRYLYDLGATWVNYDPEKKKLLEFPSLPDWARPPIGGEAPEPLAVGPEGRSQEPRAEEPPAPEAQGVDPSWCPIHQVRMKRREKDGNVWYSHRLADGTWCNYKPGDEVPASEEPWVENDRELAKFWAAANQMVRRYQPDATSEDARDWVHIACGSNTIKDWAGSPQALLEALEAALQVDTEAEEIPF